MGLRKLVCHETTPICLKAFLLTARAPFATRIWPLTTALDEERVPVQMLRQRIVSHLSELIQMLIPKPKQDFGRYSS